MFAARYFAPRYWAPRYWAQAGATAVTLPDFVSGTTESLMPVYTTESDDPVLTTEALF